MRWVDRVRVVGDFIFSPNGDSHERLFYTNVESESSWTFWVAALYPGPTRASLDYNAFSRVIRLEAQR